MCERESVEVERGESEKEREDAHSSRSVQLPTEGSLQSRVVGRLLRPPLPCSLSAMRMTMRACGFRSGNGAPASECERTKSARLGRRRGRGGRAGRTEAPRVDLGAQVERIAVRVERRVEQDRVPLSDVERDAVERRAKDGRVVGLDHLERVLVDRRVDDRVRARVDDAQADAAVGREHELGEVELPALGARGRRARRERAVVDALAVDELRVGRRSEEGLCARKRERGRVSRALIEGELEPNEGRTPLRPCGERSKSTRKSAESWYQSLSMITCARELKRGGRGRQGRRGAQVSDGEVGCRKAVVSDFSTLVHLHERERARTCRPLARPPRLGQVAAADPVAPRRETVQLGTGPSRHALACSRTLSSYPQHRGRVGEAVEAGAEGGRERASRRAAVGRRRRCPDSVDATDGSECIAAALGSEREEGDETKAGRSDETSEPSLEKVLAAKVARTGKGTTCRLQ